MGEYCSSNPRTSGLLTPVCPTPLPYISPLARQRGPRSTPGIPHSQRRRPSPPEHLRIRSSIRRRLPYTVSLHRCVAVCLARKHVDLPSQSSGSRQSCSRPALAVHIVFLLSSLKHHRHRFRTLPRYVFLLRLGGKQVIMVYSNTLRGTCLPPGDAVEKSEFILTWS